MRLGPLYLPREPCPDAIYILTLSPVSLDSLTLFKPTKIRSGMLKEIVEEASTGTLGMQFINVRLRGKQGVVKRKNATHSKQETMRIGSNSVRGQEGISRYLKVRNRKKTQQLNESMPTERGHVKLELNTLQYTQTSTICDACI